MQSQEQELRDRVKLTALKGEQIYSVLCKVSKVDKPNLTCEVATADELYKYTDIKLNAVYGFASGLNVFPKVNSFVVVTFIAKNIGYVAMYSEVEEIDVKIENNQINITKEQVDITINNTNVNVTAGGVEIVRGAMEVTVKDKIKIQNLKSDLDSLVDALKALTVPTGVGPSGTPVNFAQFDAFKTAYSQYLE